MNLTWRAQRQIIIFTIYFLVVFIPFSYITYNLLSKGETCFDSIQNQDEEGIDCNGVCSLRCDGTYRDIKITFARGFPVTDNKYDIFALLENFNQNVEFPYVPYDLSFYSVEGKLLGSASGSLAVGSQQKTAVYLPNLDILQEPKTVEFNLGPHKAVKKQDTGNRNLLSVGSWQAQRGANNSLQVVGELRNPYNEEIFNVAVYALLYDDTRTVYAVSGTRVISIKALESQAVTFTWGNLVTPTNVEFVVVRN